MCVQEERGYWLSVDSMKNDERGGGLFVEYERKRCVWLKLGCAFDKPLTG